MPETGSPDALLEAVSRVLIRCFVIVVIGLLLWGGMILLAGDWVYGVHSTVFPMTQDQFYAIHYTLIALTKIFIFLFFLVPYVSIKLVLLKK